jgi:hypothetical protein
LTKLYKVSTLFNLSDEDKAKLVDESEEFTSLDEVPYIEHEFHIGANNFIDATMIAQIYSTEMYSHGFEITGIEELPEIHIMNWKDDIDPFNINETTPQDDIICITCTCGEELKLLSNGWEYAVCPICDKIIDRSRIVKITGNSFFIKMEE